MKKITLTPVKAYEVSTEDGTEFGRFIVGKSWHGMTELKSGTSVIVFDDGVEFPDFLSGMFGGDEKLKTVNVVKASPEIMEVLQRGNKPKMPEPLTVNEVAELAEEEAEER